MIHVLTRDAEQPSIMTFTGPPSTAFAYVECDVPDEQTLVEWRRDRNAARAAERAPRAALRRRLRRRKPARRTRWAT